VKPNPLTPFARREGEKIKASLLVGERYSTRRASLYGEGFSRSREKSALIFHSKTKGTPL
jgi:hypothetical protein